jgi:asparagine synthase (glutamine-hydrolysing)
MCGITGFLDKSHSLGAEDLTAMVSRMADTLQHRGPDDHGAWVEEANGIALGFRRLAIIDLSPTGHQPMLSADRRYVIVFNGEVYNYADLRAELSGRGHTFQGTSDTEIMLTAIMEWGLEAAVRRFNGQFAFAVWDRQAGTLSLVRDRLGVKPLYYGWMGNAFLFGSELKALRAHPAFVPEIDREALTLYLRYNYIPTPYSIYQKISKLLPGCILTFNAAGPGTMTGPRPYWSAYEVAEGGASRPVQGPDQELIEQLDAGLRTSVRERMIADVPLGAFLSGGVDSSTIVALMQAQSQRPVKTFTIGFHEARYDEARYARAIAAHLGTDHTELYVTPEDARGVIPSLPQLYDEPFSDSSQIPTFLVSQLARRQVTVSLSGDGGDELFGGYQRYFLARRLWRSIGWAPPSLRRLVSNSWASLSDKDRPQEAGNPAGTSRWTSGLDRAAKLAEILDAETFDVFYLRLISLWKQPDRLVRGAREPLTLASRPEAWPPLRESTQRMMYLDLVTYLPDDILVKLDRASMGVGLEGRVPFVDDHRVVEFAWRLPQHMKVRNGQGKWILRQVLDRYVPKELVERPKRGFSVPIASWLRGPLREWAGSLLDPGRVRRDGFLDPGPIQQKWEQHLSGRRNWQYHLWDVLMFQAWLQSHA